MRAKFENGQFISTTPRQDATAQALFKSIRLGNGFQDATMGQNFDQDSGLLKVNIAAPISEFNYTINRIGNVI